MWSQNCTSANAQRWLRGGLCVFRSPTFPFLVPGSITGVEGWTGPWYQLSLTDWVTWDHPQSSCTSVFTRVFFQLTFIPYIMRWYKEKQGQALRNCSQSLSPDHAFLWNVLFFPFPVKVSHSIYFILIFCSLKGFFFLVWVGKYAPTKNGSSKPSCKWPHSTKRISYLVHWFQNMIFLT